MVQFDSNRPWSSISIRIPKKPSEPRPEVLAQANPRLVFRGSVCICQRHDPKADIRFGINDDCW